MVAKLVHLAAMILICAWLILIDLTYRTRPAPPDSSVEAQPVSPDHGGAAVREEREIKIQKKPLRMAQVIRIVACFR